MYSVANRWNHKDICPHPITFPGEGWNCSREPAAVIGLRIATKAPKDSAKLDWSNRNGLVIRIGAVAVIKAPCCY